VEQRYLSLMQAGSLISLPVLSGTMEWSFGMFLDLKVVGVDSGPFKTNMAFGIKLRVETLRDVGACKYSSHRPEPVRVILAVAGP
jgi:hypothetical protein